LFNSINNKHKYISEETTRINNEIDVLREEIKELENLRIKDLKELRYMYLLFYLPHLSGFISFNIDGADNSPSEMVSDKNFDYLISNKAQYTFLRSYSQYVNPIPAAFSKIEKQVDSKYTYSERASQIEDLNNGKVEALKKETNLLEKSKSLVRNLKVRELLAQDRAQIDIPDLKQKSLVGVLLRNGFIDEDYLDYVSIFYEGSITKSDYQFLINVKSQAPTEFDFKLYRTDKLIDKINVLEFDKEYTLNYTLLDFVLNNTKYKPVSNAIFTKLIDESAVSIKFINGYLECSTNIHAFVAQLTSRWTNIWSFIEIKSNFSQERKDKYFNLLIEHAEVDNIKKLNGNSFFKNSLLQKNNFLNIIPDIEKLKTVTKALDIKFIDLDLNEIPSELLSHIYNGNFYDLNERMVKLILKAKGRLKEIDFDSKNYFAIANADCDNLKNYIDDNINYYIEKVYLKIGTNIKEDEHYLLALLNDEDILIENKSRIIKQEETVVGTLSSIVDLEVRRILLEESKVFPIWENVINYYEVDEKNISQSIITFLESPKIASALSKIKIKTDAEGERKYTDFILELIKKDELKNETYDLILKSLPYNFTSLNLSSLSKSKVELLIRNKILTFNKSNYDSIRSSFSDLHINFIEINKTRFFEKISDFELDTADILKILRSLNISIEEKNKVLESTDETLFSSDNNLLKAIGELILKNSSFRVSDSLIKVIIVNQGLSIEQRIRLHNWKHNQIGLDYYDMFLNSLNDPYSDITINGRRPLLKNTDDNLKLVEIINFKNYISSYDIESKGIRVSTFRKNTEG